MNFVNISGTQRLSIETAGARKIISYQKQIPAGFWETRRTVSYHSDATVNPVLGFLKGLSRLEFELPADKISIDRYLLNIENRPLCDPLKYKHATRKI